ncbi:LPXTG-domain-containing protein [Botrytis cinerea]
MLLISFGLLSLVNNIALALMVTPDSPCMSLCSDGQGSDSIDGSEIVCQNENFITTTAGQKFKSCLSCLQLSTAAGNGQNDQHCFMYNIRYTLASCLYGFANATDTIATPCSTSKACGPFQLSIEDGNFITKNETAYGYCSANYNSILSGGTSACKSCLQAGNTESYLSNSSRRNYHRSQCLRLFSIYHNRNIPWKSYNTTVSSTAASKKGLSKNTIIGISVGLGIPLLIALFIIYNLWRKSVDLKRGRDRNTSLDERYGALNITAPNEGAFGNPYTRSNTITLAAPPPARKHNNANTTPPFNLSKYPSDDESLHKHDTVILPAHQAYYIPSIPHSNPYSRAEDTVPIMLEESSSPYSYPHSSNTQTPTSDPPRTFSPPTQNLARMSEISDGESFYNRKMAQKERMVRNLDRDRDVSIDTDITMSYARAAIDGTQNSGIGSSSLSPSARDVETRLDDSGEERTKSPLVDGDIEDMRESGREKERQRKKRRMPKRMSVISDHDQNPDQWPGEF